MDALNFICKISPETRKNCQIFIDDFDYETEHIISTTSEIEKVDIEPEIVENQVKMILTKYRFFQLHKLFLEQVKIALGQKVSIPFLAKYRYFQNIDTP